MLFILYLRLENLPLLMQLVVRLLEGRSNHVEPFLQMIFFVASAGQGYFGLMKLFLERYDFFVLQVVQSVH